MNIRHSLFVLIATAPAFFLACLSDDTTVINADSGVLKPDAAVDANTTDTTFVDVPNLFPDGYPSFVEGGDGDDGSIDAGSCIPVNVPNNGLAYGGGPVILNQVNVYLIWYGDWSYDPNAFGLVNDLIIGLNSSPYFNINTTYYQLDGITMDGGPTGYKFNQCGTIVYGDGAAPDAAFPLWYPSYVNGKIQLMLPSVTVDESKYGKSLSDQSIWSIVSDQLTAKSFPADPNGVYFVLTSKDVSEGTFCWADCGWHDIQSFNNIPIKYAFVGDPTACPGNCDDWAKLEDAGPDAAPTTPNGDFSVDSMASVIAHELEEATTDPEINAWVDFSESADLCAWTWGQTFSSGNGSPVNQTLNGKDWLIQQQWTNLDGGYCAQHL